ncbi:hypothetical protein KA107_00325 [Candidatus Pacearchaeota archaeon]|nr:hypothetical protein [Candidatus Pacearchaeota archaeon]
MKKGVGIVLILSLVVFSTMFASAGWFSNFIEQFTTGNSVKVTGNAIVQVPYLEQQLRGPALYEDASADCLARGMRLPTWEEASWDLNSQVLSGANSSNRIWTTTGCSSTSGRYAGAYHGLRQKVESGADINAKHYYNNCMNAGLQVAYQCLGENSSVPANQTCVDTDGGYNFDVKGDVTAGGGWADSDRCINYGEHNGWLRELACSGSTPLYTEYSCPNGCSNGACVNSTVPSNATCTDSDRNAMFPDGLNYYTAGIATGYNNGFGATSDYCADQNGLPVNSGQFIMESYCINSTDYRSQNFTCPGSCSNGACVDTPIVSCSDNKFLNITSVFNNEGKLSINFQRNNVLDIDLGISLVSFSSFGPIATVCNFSSQGCGSGSGQTYSSCVANTVCNYPSDFINKTYIVTLFDNSCITTQSSSDVLPLNQVCQSLIDSVNNPEDILNLEKEGLELKYNDSSEDYYFAGYSYLNEDVSFYISAIGESSDMIRSFLDSQLCSEVDTGFDLNSKIYSCISFEEVASPSKSYSGYNGLLVVDKGDFYLVIQQMQNYQSGEVYDEEYYYQQSVLRSQEILLDLVRNLMNNNGAAISVNNNYFDILNLFFTDCEIESFDGYGYGNWICKTEPIICPPHGEQNQICKKGDEIKERTLSCNPGICSGCIVPRWFGNSWDSKCIPYGFRFEQQIGFGQVSSSNTETLVIEDLKYYNGEVDLIVYPNNSALLTLETTQDVFVSAYLEQGKTYNWNDLFGFEDNYHDDINITVSKVYYNSEYYNKSLIELTWVSTSNAPKLISAYCDIDGQVKQQKTQSWGSCQNNYECDSNLCSYGECVDLKAIAAEAGAFKNIWSQISCRFAVLFGIESNYEQCMANNFGFITSSTPEPQPSA